MEQVNHIAMIMDGNRRWAKQNGKSTPEGHKAGYERFVEIGGLCRKKGIKTLTVYAFSTENWKRTKEEVDALMGLLRFALEQEIARLHRDGVRVRVLGRRSDLPDDLRESIRQAQELTANNTGGDLNIALSYGGRAEITDAVKDIIKKGIRVEEINEQTVADHLYTAGQADPDLIVRCGGQKRLSNFLLWQSAYAEIYFTDILWPDFDESELDKALGFFDSVKRNFGQ